MILGEPWGLLALAGLPALVALHLWRARHAPHPVSGLFLWPADRRAMATGRRRAPLLLRPSFWCEATAILAIAWWLADIHLSPRMPARHLVLVLDDRWRMQAVAGDGTSAATRLRDALDTRLAALAEGDRSTLIVSGAPPRLLAGPAVAPAAVRAALHAWTPTAAWHGLDGAITLAAGLAGPGAEIVVGSDRAPDRLPAGVGLVATGSPAANSGLADVRWWRGGDGERLVAVVQATGAGSRRLRLLRDGAECAAADLALDPAAPAMHAFALPAGLPEEAVLDLVLDGDDPLAIDDRASLIRPPLRTVRSRVVATGSAGAAASAALRAAGALPVDGADADLVASGPGPRDALTATAAWRLVVAPGDGPPTIGPFTARRDHPLLADLDLGDVVWSGGALPGRDTIPLLLAGDRTLISLERSAGTDGGMDIVVHLDPARSDLFRKVGWPVLVANLVAWRSSRLPGIADPDPRCGQPVAAVLPPGVRSAVLRGPDGSERILRADGDGQLTVPGLPRPGMWSLAAGTATWRISAQPLDPRQADLRDAATREVAPVVAGRAGVERARSPLSALLPLILAAGAGCAAWVLFRREERP